MLRSSQLVLALLALALGAASSAAAYPWPFRPFNKQHPIRGFFGDPRTVYQNGVLAGGFDGPGFFSFHQGIDISAPDGTPIYPVMSGTAHYLGAATMNVDVGDGVVFQYFHIVPIVGEGEFVIAKRTILGYVEEVVGRGYCFVPPTVMPDTRTVGIPTPTGTLWPSLPQVQRPSLRVTSLPTMLTRVSASGPLPISIAPLSGAPTFPFSTR